MHCTEGAKWPASERLIDSYGNVANPDRKLRIGYLSPDFKGNQPVAIFLKPLLRNHDHESFEIFAYSSPDYLDETTQGIAALVDHWRDVTTWSDERLAATIEADEIDILVNLAGLTAKNRAGAPERIDIDGPSEVPDLMATYRHIDIGLDPVPYNGGTTTYQTLWMGVPVVTLAGENFCASMNASILRNLGLDEHIAESEDDYVLATVRLAEDAPRRVELRIGLLETILNARSCDPAAFTLNL